MVGDWSQVWMLACYISNCISCVCVLISLSVGCGLTAIHRTPIKHQTSIKCRSIKCPSNIIKISIKHLKISIKYPLYIATKHPHHSSPPFIFHPFTAAFQHWASGEDDAHHLWFHFDLPYFANGALRESAISLHRDGARLRPDADALPGGLFQRFSKRRNGEQTRVSENGGTPSPWKIHENRKSHS